MPSRPPPSLSITTATPTATSSTIQRSNSRQSEVSLPDKDSQGSVPLTANPSTHHQLRTARVKIAPSLEVRSFMRDSVLRPPTESSYLSQVSQSVQNYAAHVVNRLAWPSANEGTQSGCHEVISKGGEGALEKGRVPLRSALKPGWEVAAQKEGPASENGVTSSITSIRD